ncbi:MAG: GAF domain-containing sensor histidine kinase [Catenulispora sp.]|nr:GAF domain-containing sensor histidine kinase [Catenulispora sp.]
MNGLQQSRPDPGEVHSLLREQQLVLIHATDQLILDHSNTLEETLRFIITRTREVLNASHVDILFQYADGLRVEISSDPAAEIGRFVPLDRSLSGLVLTNRQPVMVNDLHSDPLFREKYFPRLETDPPGHVPALGFLGAELTLDGQPIGVIDVEAPPERGFDESHLDFVTVVARQISLAITHAALFDEDLFRTATDRLLMEASNGDSDTVMRQVLDRIMSTLSSLTFVQPDAADILFTDPQDSQSLVVAYSTNNADIGVRVDIGSSIIGRAFRSGETVLLNRAFEHSDYRPLVQGMRCEMAIPIILGGNNRFPIGVLNLESSRENAFSSVGQVLAERFSRRIVNAVAMTKIRTDIDSGLQDQLMVLAADQVLNAVHRINNHVGSIRALARDLLEDLGSPNPPSPGELALQLRMIESNADHALEIPNELRKRMGAPQESVDVNGQVAAGLAAVRIPKHIELVTDLAPGLPNIPCTALDLVVENLLLNAVKAMKDQPGSLCVRSRLDQRLPREPFVVVSVRDSGVGMTPDELGRLFEPRQAGYRGSGLGFGMMWVRSWVRRAQGLIDIESEPGVGTTVNIRFQIDPQLINRQPQGGGPT